jgi:hypothetical protein
MIVVGDEGPFRRCAQRCEFSIVPIPDEDEGVRIDGAGKFPFSTTMLPFIPPIHPIPAPEGRHEGGLLRLLATQQMPSRREPALGPSSKNPSQRSLSLIPAGNFSDTPN